MSLKTMVIAEETVTTTGSTFTLGKEQIVLLKKLGLNADLIGCICDLLPLRMQLGLKGSGTQTERGFSQLYGYSLYDIFEAVTSVENDVNAIGLMSSDPMVLANRRRNIRENKSHFTVDISTVTKTNEEVYDDSIVYQFGFNLQMDDSAIVNNPYSLTTMISRPMNLEIQVFFDTKKLEELTAIVKAKAEEEKAKADADTKKPEEEKIEEKVDREQHS